MMKKFVSVIILIFMLLTLAATVIASANDTEPNFRYIVPFGRYNYCEILSNGLILVGKKVDKLEVDFVDNYTTYSIDMLYGLLDSEGKPLTDIVYFSIGDMHYMNTTSTNADGWMLARRISENKVKDELFNAKGEIILTPENSQITLYDHSYAVEIPGGYILGVNNQTYRVFKTDIRKAGINDEYPNGYTIDRIAGVFSKCFVVHCGYGVDGFIDTVVCNYDGSIRYRTAGVLRPTPDGLINESWYTHFSRKDISMTDFDGNILIPSAYGRAYIEQLYDSVTKEPVAGVYVYSGYRYDTNSSPYYEGIWDINRSGDGGFEAFRWTLYDEIVDCDTKNKLLYLKKDGKMGLYTFTGKQILPFEYTEIYRESEGLIRYYTFDILDENDWSNRYHAQGFINLDGEVVFESNDLELWDFSDGLCKFRKYDSENSRNIYGFMNDKFEVVFEKIPSDREWFWFIEDGFKDGVTIIGSENYYNGFGGFSFMNRKGETVISPEDIKIPSPPEAAKNGFLNLEIERSANGLVLLKRYYHRMISKSSSVNEYFTYGIIEYLGD